MIFQCPRCQQHFPNAVGSCRCGYHGPMDNRERGIDVNRTLSALAFFAGAGWMLSRSESWIAAMVVGVLAAWFASTKIGAFIALVGVLAALAWFFRQTH